MSRREIRAVRECRRTDALVAPFVVALLSSCGPARPAATPSAVDGVVDDHVVAPVFEAEPERSSPSEAPTSEHDSAVQEAGRSDAPLLEITGLSLSHRGRIPVVGVETTNRSGRPIAGFTARVVCAASRGDGPLRRPYSSAVALTISLAAGETRSDSFALRACCGASAVTVEVLRVRFEDGHQEACPSAAVAVEPRVLQRAMQGCQRYLERLAQRREQDRARPPSPVEARPDERRCRADGECILVAFGCCDCGHGGSRVAVNRAARAGIERRRRVCRGVSCPAISSRSPSCGRGARALCRSGGCEVVGGGLEL